MLTFYSSSFFVEKKNVQNLLIFFFPLHPHKTPNPQPPPPQTKTRNQKKPQVKFCIRSGFNWNNNLVLQKYHAWQTQEGTAVFLHLDLS